MIVIRMKTTVSLQNHPVRTNLPGQPRSLQITSNLALEGTMAPGTACSASCINTPERCLLFELFAMAGQFLPERHALL